MNQATREGIATAYAVYDRIDFITLGLVELLAVKYQGFPTVERGGITLAQRRYDILEAKLLTHLTEDALITCGIGLPALYVGIGLEAQAKFCVFLVANTYVNVLHKGTHNGDSLFRRPQFFTEIKVNANFYAVTLSSLTSQAGEFCRTVGYGRRDTTPVEPIGAVHDLVKVEILGQGFGNGTMSAVVYNLGGTHRSTRLGIIKTYTVTAPSHEAGIHPIAAQCIQGYLPYLMFG